MTPTDEVITWTPVWLVLLAVAVGIGVHLLIRFTRDSWREIGARIDRDMAEMVNGGAPRQATNCDLGLHPGPLSRYSNYAIWLCCGQREDQPQPHQCRITGCHKPATHLFDRPSTTGIFYVCSACAAAVREWAGPYDQELDQATDLGQWNREIDAS